MTNSRFTSSATLLCACVAASFAMCGCTSMKGASDKWATAWKKSTEPKPADPNHEEIVTYWGQKKKQTTVEQMPAELKERLAKKTDPSQMSRDYADNLRLGNQRLKEGRLDEARRAYETALATRPDDPDVHHRLAVVADKQQMFGAADDHYEAALRKRPRDPSLLSDIGYSHVLRGDDRGAEQTLREALAIDPSHKGAMLNLSTLFGKQGRYEDALALLKQGTTEAEARQYMAQLFPQGRPADVSLTSNQTENVRRAPQMPSDERLDVRNMTLDQLKAEMERRQQLEGTQNRQPQFAQTPAQTPSQTDWTGSPVTQDPRVLMQQRPGIASETPGSAQGQAPGNQMANSPPMTNQTFPTIGQSPPSSLQMQPGTSTQPGSQVSPNPVVIAPNGTPQQQGIATNSTQGSLVAPPGTNPHSNIDFWQGAPVQSNGSASNMPSPQSMIEQMGHMQRANAGGLSASQAAAQLGMSAGPGSLFPFVASDPASNGGMNRQQSVAPAYEQRYGSEYSQPQQYQNLNHQTAPNRMPNQGRVLLLGNDGSVSNQDAPNRPGSSTSGPNGMVQQVAAGNDVMMTPSSSANNMFSPWDSTSNWQQPASNTGSGVVQAGGSTAWDQWPQGDPQNSSSSDKRGSGFSRYAKTPWDDGMSQPGGSRPYNGAWPNNNAAPNAGPAGGGNAPNSLPMWNGGNGTAASMPAGGGFANEGSSNSSLPQWPYSPQR